MFAINHYLIEFRAVLPSIWTGRIISFLEWTGNYWNKIS